MNNKKRIALIYDFDKTLSTKNMQEFTLFRELNLSPREFWDIAQQVADESKMDNILAFMYVTILEMKKRNIKLTKNLLNSHGNDIEFYDGVETWFDRINKYSQKLNVEIEHYIISAGLKEIIDGSKIAKEFKCIFASEYHYDKEGVADWPLISINYTGKTQYLYRINKQVLEINDDDGINSFMAENDRPIPFSNMIYIGDGLTDVPCMKLVKQNGGCSIAVTTEKTNKIVNELKDAKRVDFICNADYSNNSELDKTIKAIIEYIARKI